MLQARKDALAGYLEEARQIASAQTASSHDRNAVTFLEEKAIANEAFWQVYNGQAGAEKETAFFDASGKSWTEELPAALERLNGIIKGPFVLGDQIVS